MRLHVKHLKLAALLTMTAAFMAGAPAFGAEFTTPDSVLTLETPGDDWKQVRDDQTWATLTDGEDKITLLHYSNGEKLPEMTVAGKGYAQVCQNVISTENEVFIITGSVVDKEDFEEVQKAVQSAVINKYDTKTKVQPALGTAGISESAGESGAAGGAAAETANNAGKGTVESAGFTVWVTSQQLNVRSGSSTDTAVLGTAYYADALEVTGIEKVNGAETGWYRINYNGTVGYVSSAYVSAAPSTAETLGYTLTDEQVTVYAQNGSAAVYVYKATNGNWYDGSGRQYQSNGSGQWTCLTSGSTWTETASQTPADKSVSQVEVTDEEGYNSQTLYLSVSGVWQNGAGGTYTDNGDGTWTGTDGTVWSQK